MTPADLYNLIQSDAIASASYAAGDDEQCAVRCSAIAPLVRRPLDAARVQEIASLNGLWGRLKMAALDHALGDPPRGAALAFVDWVTANRPLNPDNPAIMQLAGLLISHGLATEAQIDQLVEAASVPQTITAADVGAARQHGGV